MKLGILGTGTIASAVVRGIAADGHTITVSERSRARAEELAAAFDCVTISDNQTVIDQSEVVFLGLMAEAAEGILSNLTFRADQRVISFMAGASLEQVSKWVAPASAEAIMLPFPAIATGGSPIIAQGKGELLETLFGANNSVFLLEDEKTLAAYLSAQAVLSPVARMVDDAAKWLGERVEDPAQGEAFLRALVASSLAATPSADLIEALNTEGGYNQRLRVHMEASGMSQSLSEGLDKL